MKKNIIYFVGGVIACMLFSLIHVSVARGLGFGGVFADQGPDIFAGGVLVAILFKNKL